MVDAARCDSCQKKVVVKKGKCILCGSVIGDAQQQPKVTRQKRVPHIDYEAERIEEVILLAEERIYRRKRGNLVGIFACISGVLGVVSVGFVFVPLAALLAVIAITSSTLARNGAGQAIGVLAIVLTGAGFVASPSLWLLAGTAASSYSDYKEKAKAVEADSVLPKEIIVKPDLPFAGDFRQFYWGDTISHVRAHQNGEITKQASDVLFYEDRLSGVDVGIFYRFLDGRLFSAGYLSREKHLSGAKFVDDYNNINILLTKKYGAPKTVNIIWGDDLYKGDPQNIGIAILTGNLNYRTTWQIGSTTIKSAVTGGDFKISHGVIYRDDVRGKRFDRKQEGKSLDLL